MKSKPFYNEGKIIMVIIIVCYVDVADFTVLLISTVVLSHC